MAEPKGDVLGDDVLSTISAAARLGVDVSLLLAGEGVQNAAEHAGSVQGIKQVCADVRVHALCLCQSLTASGLHGQHELEHILCWPPLYRC